MQYIDLNSDLGESFGVYKLGNDREVLKYVSSVNVACGFHAGDPLVALETVRVASEANVAVGAHPGYPDLLGFGRRAMRCTPEEVYAYCIYQIGSLEAACKVCGVSLQHVKVHGALYNQAAVDLKLAKAIAKAAKDMGLILLGLANSSFERAAEEVGVPFAAEAFADRAYRDDGTLLPRDEPEAVIRDPQVVGARAVKMAREGVVESVGGVNVKLLCHSICLHGDNPAAVAIAQTVREMLEAASISIRPLKSLVFR